MPITTKASRRNIFILQIVENRKKEKSP